jgi:hypothetical protein
MMARGVAAIRKRARCAALDADAGTGHRRQSRIRVAHDGDAGKGANGQRLTAITVELKQYVGEAFGAPAGAVRNT